MDVIIRFKNDLYCMMNSSVKDEALADIELLDKVVQFKEKFYHCPWARYDLAKVGTLKLIPPERNMQALKEDYVIDKCKESTRMESTQIEENNLRVTCLECNRKKGNTVEL